MTPQELYSLMESRFNMGELQKICFEFNFYLEDLPGETRRLKLQGLITHFTRRRSLDALWDEIVKVRPKLQDLEPEFAYPPGDKWEDESRPIPWDEVKETCNKRNRHQAKLLQDKYEAELYVAREEIQENIARFKESESPRYLFLIGRSGMGKSGLLSNVEQSLREDPNTACLVYDCGSLRGPGEETGSNFLNDLATGHLPDPNLGLIDELLSRIEQAEGFDASKHRLLIIADAINESKSVDKIIKWLCYLQEGGDRPWVKAIISGRPHIWQKLQEAMLADFATGGGFADAYFYQANEDAPLFLEVGHFSKQEARKAYELHQRKFKLVPESYDELESAVRERLMEPLVLWLVANICAHGERRVDRDVVTTDLKLIPDYTKARLKKLRKGKRVASGSNAVKDKGDSAEKFLENTLPAQMIDENMCRNSLPPEDVEKLSEKHEVDLETCLHLGLLQKTGEGHVRFRYERFYDYYFSGQLRKRTANESETKALDCAPADI